MERESSFGGFMNIENRKVALLLSGSGHLDGAEITEAVSLILALSESGFEIDYFAPDRPQLHTINHKDGSQADEERSILNEAARIARGNINVLSDYRAEDYSALLLPGGFGAVKNFTKWIKSERAELEEDIYAALNETYRAEKPILAICAAPFILGLFAHEAQLEGVEITFGSEANSTDFMQTLSPFGITHIESGVEEFHHDEKHRFITSGAYMFADAKPHQIYNAAKAAVKKMSSTL